jgi:hypothetical protein
LVLLLLDKVNNLRPSDRRKELYVAAKGMEKPQLQGVEGLQI